MIDRSSFTCQSCRVRFQLGPPLGEPPSIVELSGKTLKVLRQFAAQFDKGTCGRCEGSGFESRLRAGKEEQTTDPCPVCDGSGVIPTQTWTAMDFIDWMEPSVRDSDRYRVVLSVTSMSNRDQPKKVPEG